jgi:putative beta-lysine N-acetyltransferase
MRFDAVERRGHSLIQHGTANDRVYLMKLAPEDYPQIIAQIHDLAQKKRYSKIFTKVPAWARTGFEQQGFRLEAAIPGFYGGREEGLFLCRYLQSDRLIDPDADRVQEVLAAARARMTTTKKVDLAPDCTCRLLTEDDCEIMAALYRQIFASYPFPIHDPSYLARTMNENVVYAGIIKNGALLAVASAEIDHQGSNAELTDFATDQRCQGQGLANLLLAKLEEITRARGIRTCYTIARATSFGMNICFAANGYQYGGTLIKNTQIAGSLESMNVWYKALPKVH